MRTRRYRPSVNFRPGIDLLMPRIAPSDIAVFLYLNGDTPAPAPGQVPPSAIDPGTLPLCPIWTGPTEDPTPDVVTAATPYSYSVPVTAN